MPDENIDFHAALQRSVEGNVRFVLIGGLAMIARGAAHITVDIDVTYDRSADDPTLGHH